MVREAKNGSVPAAEWIRKVLGKGLERHQMDSGTTVVLRPHPCLMDDDEGLEDDGAGE